MPKSERKKYVGLFTKLLSHHKCEAYSNDAQTLGNVGPAAGPESWLWAPMNELRSRLTTHIYILLCYYCVVSVFDVCQTKKQTSSHTNNNNNNNNCCCRREKQQRTKSPSSGMGLGMMAPVRLRVFRGGGITCSVKLCAGADLLLLCCVRVCVCALVCFIVVAFLRDCANLLLFATI